MKRMFLPLLLFAAGGLYGQTTAYRDEAFTGLFRRTSGWTAGELSGSVLSAEVIPVLDLSALPQGMYLVKVRTKVKTHYPGAGVICLC